MRTRRTRSATAPSPRSPPCPFVAAACGDDDDDAAATAPAATEATPPSR